jgi:hypothetical protein
MKGGTHKEICGDPFWQVKPQFLLATRKLFYSFDPL